MYYSHGETMLFKKNYFICGIPPLPQGFGFAKLSLRSAAASLTKGAVSCR